MSTIAKMLRANARPDAPADVSERARYGRALQQASYDRRDRYPMVTVENFDAAIAYQEERIRFYLSEGR